MKYLAKFVASYIIAAIVYDLLYARIWHALDGAEDRLRGILHVQPKYHPFDFGEDK